MPSRAEHSSERCGDALQAGNRRDINTQTVLVPYKAMRAATVATHRFGLGARPDEPIPSDPRQWLLAQLDLPTTRPPSWQQLPSTAELTRIWLAQQRAVRQAPEGQRAGIREAYLRRSRGDYLAAIGARVDTALQTQSPFVERLVHFWANHFAVSVDKLLVIGLAGAFEADAIRPHVMGRFEDMLLATARHPAMLLYLDQAQSIGPNSLVGGRSQGSPQRGRGLNENLAREILELHTLGVRGGYQQDDVTELARALTGWTLPDDRAEASATDASYRFVPALHEPGARRIAGRVYPEAGAEQALAILRHLAATPSTARHIATKLVRHFVADEPPSALVQRLEDAFLRSDGHLPTVYRALLTADQAWEPQFGKFKTPWEWSIASLRALNAQTLPPAQASGLMTQLGQPVWRPGSPAGFDDTAATWAAPDALMRRIEAAQRLARQAGGNLDARTLGVRILPGALSESTERAIFLAESGEQALTLLLVSPEFLRG